MHPTQLFRVFIQTERNECKSFTYAMLASGINEVQTAKELSGNLQCAYLR